MNRSWQWCDDIQHDRTGAETTRRGELWCLHEHLQLWSRWLRIGHPHGHGFGCNGIHISRVSKRTIENQKSPLCKKANELLYNYYITMLHALHLSVFIGLKLCFWLDHLVLVLPGAHFLGLCFGLGGTEKWGMALLLSHAIACLLSSWKAWLFLCSKGKGIMVLLHGENTEILAIWSFL